MLEARLIDISKSSSGVEATEMVKSYSNGNAPPEGIRRLLYRVGMRAAGFPSVFATCTSLHGTFKLSVAPAIRFYK